MPTAADVEIARLGERIEGIRSQVEDQSGMISRIEAKLDALVESVGRERPINLSLRPESTAKWLAALILGLSGAGIGGIQLRSCVSEAREVPVCDSATADFEPRIQDSSPEP